MLLNEAGDLVTKDTEKVKVLTATIFLVLLVRPAFRTHRPLRPRGKFGARRWTLVEEEEDQVGE